MAVLDGVAVTEVAAEAGVSHQSVHAWVPLPRGGLGWGGGSLARGGELSASGPGRGGGDRVRAATQAPKWGAQRLLHELMRAPAAAGAVAVARDDQPHPGPP